MPIKKSLFLFGLLPLTVFAQGDNPIITVYSTQDYPIIHAELASHVYLLDQVEQWENQMSHQLSANPNIAIQQAMQIFQSAAWKPAEERLKQSYPDPGEENLVVYGETNVDNALKRLASWQQQKNKEVAK